MTTPTHPQPDTPPGAADERIVVFLQNAWSPFYAGGEWPRPSWIRALKASRSGQRLRVMIDDYEVCENTTPIVGATPDSVIKPDVEHITRLLARRKPQVVVACGKQAETILSKLWPGALLAVPHPAHRLLTDNLYREARLLLSTDFTGRVALRQMKGYCNCERIAGELEAAQS